MGQYSSLCSSAFFLNEEKWKWLYTMERLLHIYTIARIQCVSASAAELKDFTNPAYKSHIGKLYWGIWVYAISVTEL